MDTGQEGIQDNKEYGTRTYKEDKKRCRTRMDTGQ